MNGIDESSSAFVNLLMKDATLHLDVTLNVLKIHSLQEI